MIALNGLFRNNGFAILGCDDNVGSTIAVAIKLLKVARECTYTKACLQQQDTTHVMKIRFIGGNLFPFGTRSAVELCRFPRRRQEEESCCRGSLRDFR